MDERRLIHSSKSRGNSSIVLVYEIKNYYVLVELDPSGLRIEWDATNRLFMDKDDYIIYARSKSENWR